MKTNELIRGDIILYEYDGQKFPARVIEIYRSSVLVESVDGEYEPIEIEEDKIFPVGLTPEILEKNGFKYDGSGQRCMMLMTPHGESGTRWNIYVGLKRKTIEVFSAPPVEKSPGWRKSNKVYLEVCGCFVHELQHALRLCGITLNIEV